MNPRTRGFAGGAVDGMVGSCETVGISSFGFGVGAVDSDGSTQGPVDPRVDQ